MQSTPPSPEPSKRLYFALWPDASMQEELASATRAIVQAGNGRAVPSRNFHITLAFLGSVPERRLAELDSAARRAVEALGTAARTVEMTLDRVEHWLRPRVLCAIPGSDPPAARSLADALKQTLVDANFAPDLKPFRPHVTLARKVSRANRESSMPAVTWKFDVFSLVESRTEPAGALYSVVDSWRLDGGEKSLKK